MQKVKIIQSIDRQLPLDDIASAEGLDFDDLLTKIEEIVYSGTKLNIDYFLEDVYDEDQIVISMIISWIVRLTVLMLQWKNLMVTTAKRRYASYALSSCQRWLINSHCQSDDIIFIRRHSQLVPFPIVDFSLLR